MKKITLFIITSFFLLTGCDTAVKDNKAATFPTDDIKIETSEQTKYSYKGKSYLWTGSLTIVNDPDGKWVAPTFDTNALVATSIRKQLSKNGLREASDSADIVVAYGIGIDMDAINLKSYADINTKGLKKMASGTLVIVLADRRTQNVLWVASAEAEYKNLAPDVAKSRIKYAVNKIFNQLPK